MLRFSSDGDICASVSHDAAAAPTFPIAVGKRPSAAPLSLSLPLSLPLSFIFSVSRPCSLPPSDSLVTQACRRGTHCDEIEVGSCSFSPRVII